MKKFAIILIILTVALCLFYRGLQKRFYRTISQETLVGIIRCANSSDTNYGFYLFYFPIKKGAQSDFRLFKLRGKDWSFEGEIIKWKRPLNVLGVKTTHRPTRIYDSYGTSYPLETRPKKIAFKFMRLFPSVDTSFISGVRQSFKLKLKFGIYATNSGYLIRRIR